MRKLSLSTKAQTLEKLGHVITQGNVLPIYIFSAVNYPEYKNKILEEIQLKFTSRIIVRSSSANEDNFQASNAGGFVSVLNVNSRSSSDIDAAIVEVIKSYDDICESDEIFVQPMLENVVMSGVVFSADIDTLSPYYIINYDESGSTSSVTGGEHNDLKTFICLKRKDYPKNDKLNQLMIATRECEEIFDNQYLDIEFAYVADTLYILQVRAIVLKNKEDLSYIDIHTGISKLYKKIHKLNAQHPNLLGKRTIFGVMPDWNPAEIIGIRPKRLALSLYKELITDETWAYQRDNYGYRNLRSHPLLVSFLGVPFIDVRVSFNSFIPKKLDEKVAEKLVDNYLNELADNVRHHDKVEFEIIYSCYYFGVDQDLLRLKNKGFTEEEITSIESSLLEVTNNIIDISKGLYKKDLEKIEILKRKYNEITESDLPIIDKIYWLIKDVKRYGTLPFAGVARAGFIAVQMLRSLVSQSIISQGEYDSFLNSLNTISKESVGDRVNLSKKEFIEKYGHLRPGTYDILSHRYDEAYDIYFSSEPLCSHDAKDFKFTQSQEARIGSLIDDAGLNTNFSKLITFIKEAIEGREYAKFVFTKHLSQVLKYVEDFGSKFDFSRDELAFLDIQKVVNLYSTLDHRDVRDILDFDIEKNKEFYKYTKAIKLPSIIIKAEDVFSFYLEENEPNYITLKSVESEIVLEGNISEANTENKIVCIKSADPGYDYLFSKNIAGLITCYGGANSHMAIRCAEIGIPAVIGCGESAFEMYTKARVLEINSANKNVKILA